MWAFDWNRIAWSNPWVGQSHSSLACVAGVRRGGRGVKRASTEKHERSRHTRGEAGTRSLTHALVFSALACVTSSPSPSDACHAGYGHGEEQDVFDNKDKLKIATLLLAIGKL